MDEIEFGKKYLLSCYNYESEGVYLGKLFKKNTKNRHIFMAWHSFMKKGQKPVIIGCRDFKIHKENKLETIPLRMYFPKLSDLEERFVTELAKKYWR